MLEFVQQAWDALWAIPHVGLYLTLGWLGALSGYLLWRRSGLRFIRPLLLGGVAYSVGAVAEFVRWPVLIPGVMHAHEAFHLAVIIGALCHWSFIWQFANAEPSARAPGRRQATARVARGRGAT